MARRLRLSKAMFFFTTPEKRIILTQVEPECEIPDVLKPHELEQIANAIKQGRIKEVSPTFQEVKTSLPQDKTSIPQTQITGNKNVAPKRTQRISEPKIVESEHRQVTIRIGDHDEPTNSSVNKSK